MTPTQLSYFSVESYGGTHICITVMVLRLVVVAAGDLDEACWRAQTLCGMASG